MRIFVAGLRKLVRRLASWLTFGLLCGILILIFVAVGATTAEAEGPEAIAAQFLLTFPGAYEQIVAFILGLAGLLAVIYGAAIAGSEWGWGTLKSAVARGESRSGYMLATFAAVTLMIGIGLVLAFGVGVGAAVVGANLAGISTEGLGDTETLAGLPERLARTWLGITTIGALGFAIATLARSQLAGIGVGIGLFFGEQFAGIFLPDIVRWLPFNAATAVLSVPQPPDGGGGPVFEALDPNLALLVAGAWLVGSLLVAALFTERAEIAG
jgi:hypothetical protein